MGPFNPRVRSSSTERQVKNWLNFTSSGTSGSLIVSIQKGTVVLNNVLTNTATISAVVLANSILIYDGAIYSGNTVNTADGYGQLVLTNTTTITGTRGLNNDGLVLTLYFTIIEFNAGVLNSAVQRGVITMTNSASTTATISSVVIAKSLVFFSGFSSDSNTIGRAECGLTLTNATTVTCTNGIASGNLLVPYQVVEWK